MAMYSSFKHPLPLFGLAALLLGPACSDDTGTTGTSGASDSATETSDTDTDTDTDSMSGEEEMTDSMSGDGDGDSGDGDGDPATATDTMGDGDGDPSGDGDGDASGDGDGDASGDGDGDSGDGDGDSGDGDGDPGEDVCGDGMVTGDEVCDDGVNDGSYEGCAEDCLSNGPFCGDGEVNGPEECDDANQDDADGCVSICEIPTSCLDILIYDDNAPSGPYMIAPVDPDSTFEVDCDMDTDGGGWTGLSLASMCNGDLDTELIALEAAVIEGIDEQCRPFTQDDAGTHGYQWDIEFPPGYDEFYLSDYVFKANARQPNDTTDVWLSFAQTAWDQPYSPGGSATGDVSFGSPDDPGPVTSYGAEIEANIECTECETPFPANMTPYVVGANSSVFRISWGERGGQFEGFYPWWSGTVYLR